jgi:hypothetical protein
MASATPFERHAAYMAQVWRTLKDSALIKERIPSWSEEGQKATEGTRSKRWQYPFERGFMPSGRTEKKIQSRFSNVTGDEPLEEAARRLETDPDNPLWSTREGKWLQGLISQYLRDHSATRGKTQPNVPDLPDFLTTRLQPHHRSRHTRLLPNTHEFGTPEWRAKERENQQLYTKTPRESRLPNLHIEMKEVPSEDPRKGAYRHYKLVNSDTGESLGRLGLHQRASGKSDKGLWSIGAVELYDKVRGHGLYHQMLMSLLTNTELGVNWVRSTNRNPHSHSSHMKFIPKFRAEGGTVKVVEPTTHIPVESRFLNTFARRGVETPLDALEANMSAAHKEFDKHPDLLRDKGIHSGVDFRVYPKKPGDPRWRILEMPSSSPEDQRVDEDDPPTEDMDVDTGEPGKYRPASIYYGGGKDSTPEPEQPLELRRRRLFARTPAEQLDDIMQGSIRSKDPGVLPIIRRPEKRRENVRDSAFINEGLQEGDTGYGSHQGQLLTESTATQGIGDPVKWKAGVGQVGVDRR